MTKIFEAEGQKEAADREIRRMEGCVSDEVAGQSAGARP